MPWPQPAEFGLHARQQKVRCCHGVQATDAEQRQHSHGAHRSIEAPTVKIRHRLASADGIAKPTPERSNPHIESGLLGQNIGNRTIAAVRRDPPTSVSPNLATTSGRASASMTRRVTTEGMLDQFNLPCVGRASQRQTHLPHLQLSPTCPSAADAMPASPILRRFARRWFRHCERGSSP